MEGSAEDAGERLESLVGFLVVLLIGSFLLNIFWKQFHQDFGLPDITFWKSFCLLFTVNIVGFFFRGCKMGDK
jgi:hypothetical protein